ncbi:uncharacterized protein BDV17DRAFT_294243 [Aspergillus undulatus]|uniref:uncharacterized protein n=1 Tax=Aspergillus undulatus TaxID=1810928 RepID=UPI003CCCCE84
MPKTSTTIRTDPRIPLIVRPHEQNSLSIGQKAHGFAKGPQTGTLYFAYGETLKVLTIPMISFVVPFPATMAGTFDHLTHKHLRNKQREGKKMGDGKEVIEVASLGDVIEDGIWLNPEGEFMVGPGKVIHVGIEDSDVAIVKAGNMDASECFVDVDLE